MTAIESWRRGSLPKVTGVTVPASQNSSSSTVSMAANTHNIQQIKLLPGSMAFAIDIYSRLLINRRLIRRTFVEQDNIDFNEVCF